MKQLAKFRVRFALTALVFCLHVLVCESIAQQRKAGAANTVEAALSEYSISGEQLETLVGETASVLLMDGTVLSNATLSAFTTRRRDDRVAMFRVEADGKNRKYPAAKVYSFKVGSNAYKVNYLPSAKAAAVVDVQEQRAAVTEQLQKIRRKFWSEFTPEEQEENVDQHKGFLSKVAKHFGPRFKMQLTETKYFLFLSDMPRQLIAPILLKLDAMNEKLGQAFGYEPGFNIWKGKAVIVAFQNKVHFVEFEQEFMNKSDVGSSVQGLCHSYSNGRVVVGCYRGNSTSHFSGLIVHETAHGYVARFRTNARIPSWLNEGLSDWIAGIAVPGSKTVRNRQRDAAKRLRALGTFGGQFFEAKQIEGWQYGAASSIVNLLISKDPIRFKLFINGVKEGLTWQDSLRRAYNASAEELCRLYGRSIGMPSLRP